MIVRPRLHVMRWITIPFLEPFSKFSLSQDRVLLASSVPEVPIAQHPEPTPLCSAVSVSYWRFIPQRQEPLPGCTICPASVALVILVKYEFFPVCNNTINAPCERAVHQFTETIQPEPRPYTL